MEKCWCGNESLEGYSEDYYKCTSCGTLVSKNAFSEEIYQISNEEEDLYGKNYWLETMVREAAVEKVSDLLGLYLNGRGVYWLKYALKYFKLGGTAAEVGCGLGQFSYLLQKSGFAVTAYELSEEICGFIRNTFGIRVLCGELTEGEKYDTVAAFDVFEHLMHPRSFLRIVRNALTENGVLCMQLPCYDSELSFSEMKEKKPNFQKLLVPDQHIYIYSKDAVRKILAESGFPYVTFEHAFFGDDYDMFLFASGEEIKVNDDSTIEQYLKSMENGLLIKSHIELFDERERLLKETSNLQSDRKQQLSDIKTLTAMVKEKEKENVRLKTACGERLQNISELTKQLTSKNRELLELKPVLEKLSTELQYKDSVIGNLESSCSKRLQDINKLTQLQDEKEKQINIYRLAAEERLGEIQKLNALLQGSNERLIEANTQIEIFKKAAQERLDEIKKLNDLLKTANDLIFEKEKKQAE